METQRRRRRRPALACANCRRRKIKCDHSDPCANCLRHNTQCVYTLYSDGHEPRAVVQSDFDQEQQLGIGTGSSRDGIQTGISSLSIQAQQLTPSVTGSTCSTTRSVTEHASRDHRQNAQPLESRSTAAVLNVRVPNPVSVSRDTSLSGQEYSTSSQTKPRDLQSQVVMNKPRDLGKTGWAGISHEFTIITTCYSEMIGKNVEDASFKAPETAALVAEAADFLRGCKDMAKDLKVSRPSRALPPLPELRFPPRSVADAMVKLYFASFESTHRILHGPTFWAEYQRYYDLNESSTCVVTELHLKILLVIGIGSSLQTQSTDDGLLNVDMVHKWIYAAQTWLSGPLEKDRLCVDGLQIYCLTILARQIFSVGGDLVWVSMGELVHRAMRIGLHRDPKQLPAMSILQAELRRRLWATILDLVVQSSLDTWMPPRISFGEFDTEAPSNVNDEDMDESTVALHSYAEGIFTTTSMQLVLLESLPVRLRIVKLLNGLHSELSYPRVLELSAELTEALQKCSQLTRNDDCTPFHRNLLDYLVRRFLMPLHMSFSNQAFTNPLFHYSLKVSLDTAMAIISPEPDEGFSSLMAMAGGMFREGLRWAMTAVSLELLARVKDQRLDGTLRRAHHYLDVRKQAVRDLLSLSEERIRQGETNVKSHMFLSMILAQVEAIETGLPVELQVAQGARDSLEFCHNLLSIKATSAPTPLAPPDDEDFMVADFDGDYSMDGLNFDWNLLSPHARFP